ncbi:uncharacterized protein LOC123317402 [Coccinella septempunctata]|uniref:uncharacterized protein LOC123317402 n=1 Tax=Coccinella septempunctata TaxID=41139 RepID=UPI001D083F5C|nr:uncharacterized protein LOC123317402 [Coccinella septempunctata]XP_044759852.1 uncharacterized protein LOC123317402 [Coccinella septempunctata]
MKYSSSNLGFTLIIFQITGVLSTIDRLELIMPKYAIRGGDVILRCDHSVPPEQLYKVEWQKGGEKIFQYIKGRSPPFRYFETPGAVINKSNSSAKQMQLSKLDFSASGSYSCVVSMETPIFSKDSESKDLIIIEPQLEDPKITFNKETYEIGEVLEANCTTAPARPPPHITWLINGEKVVDKLTKSFTNGFVHGKGYFEQRASSIKQLSIEVAELHVGDDNQLILTCMSTIPGYITVNDNYADMRKKSINIDIVVTEPEVEAISNDNSSSGSLRSNYIFMTICFAVLIDIGLN